VNAYGCASVSNREIVVVYIFLFCHKTANKNKQENNNKKIMIVMHVKFDKHLTLIRLHFTLYILSLIGK